MLLTDNETLIRCAESHYDMFKVPTMVIDSKKRKRKYTNNDKASLDIFCDSDNIGIIVNLSQEINTIMWDRINRNKDMAGAMDAYYDNCLLSILSSISIDSAKKEYAINCMEEYKIVRAKYNEKDEIGRAIRPYFFAHVAKKKGFYDMKKKNYMRHMAPMDCLNTIINEHVKLGKRDKKKPILSIGEIVKDLCGDKVARNGYVDIVLLMVRELDSKTRMLYQVGSEAVANSLEKKKMTDKYFEDCVQSIRSMNLNSATMRDLLIEMDNPANSTIKRKLWIILFSSLGDEMMKLMKRSKGDIYSLEECAKGEAYDVTIFDIPYKYVKNVT